MRLTTGLIMFAYVFHPPFRPQPWQDQTKALRCEVVLSDEVFEIAGLAPDALPQQEIFVPGREAPIRVRTATTTAEFGAAMGVSA